MKKLFPKKGKLPLFPQTKYFHHPRHEKIAFTVVTFPCDIYTSQSREEKAEFSRQILSFPGRSKQRTIDQLMKTL